MFTALISGMLAVAYTSTVQDNWTNQYAGSKLDLSGYVLNFEDSFDRLSVTSSSGSETWKAPVRAPYGAAKFVAPTAAVNPFSVGEGALTIRMQQVDGAWQSGHMQTVNAKNEGFSQTYGYFEMRAKFEGGIGAWPAFWLLPADPSKPRVEIDIVEAYGGDADGHHAAVHFTPNDDTPFEKKVGKSDYTDLHHTMFDGQYHTYGGLVTPDWIIIYYDGVELTRFKSNEYVDVPLYMNVSLAMTTKEVAKASGDYSMTVDYVRAYADPDITGVVTRDRAASEQIEGTARNDTLHGAAGDVLIGGAGDDTYRLGGANVKVVERAGGGADTIVSEHDIILAEEVENGRLEGSANATIIGNEVGNLLEGNSADNVLDGRSGADTMKGGSGSDTYYVDSPDDVVIDDATEGADEVISSVSFSLSGKRMAIEKLTLIGDADINATGNGMKNHLVGNAGDNLLDGRDQDDTMAGGAGNDTYIVDSMAEKIIENDGGGIDCVRSSQTFSLGKFTAVENLTLTGAAAINATGNTLDNVLTGNAGANVIDGKAGADILSGGGGSDTLTGGSGADAFVFDTPLASAGVDMIKDFKVSDDTIHLAREVFQALGGPGVLPHSAFVIGSVAADASDRIVYDNKTGELFYDADGVGGIAQVKFAQLSGGLGLSAQDFLVF